MHLTLSEARILRDANEIQEAIERASMGITDDPTVIDLDAALATCPEGYKPSKFYRNEAGDLKAFSADEAERFFGEGD